MNLAALIFSDYSAYSPFIKSWIKIAQRFILCLDTNTKKARLKTLDSIKKKLEEKLSTLQQKYTRSCESNRKKKMTQTNVIAQALTILGKNKRLFDISFEKGLQYSLDENAWGYEQNIAGKFLLVTNTDIDPGKAMIEYKRLQTVENAFDDLKNVLNIRPIYHRLERRVKAHIFVCMLAFLVKCIMERFLLMTANKAIFELRTIR